MTKRDLILNTMQELFQEGIAGTASVNDIATRAGIAKGGLYYYFKNKEEVMDALVDRQYSNIIANCKKLIQESNLNAIDNLALLLSSYKSAYVDPSLNEYLHLPQNAAIHQKSLAKILISLSEVIREVINQGVNEGLFKCEYSEEYSEIIMAVFTFLLDPGIFTWSKEQVEKKMKALARMLEKGLDCPEGTFEFLYMNDNNSMR